MSKTARRNQHQAAAEKLFALIDSYAPENLELAEALLKNNRALQDRARNRYEGLMRRIDPDLGGSWAILKRVPERLEVQQELTFFCDYYKELGDIQAVQRVVQQAAEYSFKHIYSVDALNDYMSLGDCIEAVADSVSLSYEEATTPLNISQPRLLSKLEHLSLYNCPNAAAELQAHLGEMPLLCILRLDNCQLQSLPPLAQLQNLETLGLSQNQISSLPPTLASLPKLKHLNISQNPLNAWPAALENCKHLEELTLADCGLTQWPDWINKLGKLVYICVNNNPLRYLPAQLFEIQSLAVIDAENIQLQRIELSKQLPPITSLSIARNSLPKLPKEIWQFPQLCWLNIEKCNLTSIAEDIKNLQHLETLRLNENPIKELPHALSKILALTEISANQCPLNGLPDLRNTALQMLNLKGISKKRHSYFASRVPEDCHIYI